MNSDTQIPLFSQTRNPKCASTTLNAFIDTIGERVSKNDGIAYFCPPHATFGQNMEYIERFYSSEEISQMRFLSSVREPVERGRSAWNHLGVRSGETDPNKWIQEKWLKWPNDFEMFDGGMDRLKIFRTDNLDQEMEDYCDENDFIWQKPERRNTRELRRSRRPKLPEVLAFTPKTVAMIHERFDWTYEKFGFERPIHS